MFGPWQRDINPVERRARCRALAALGGVFAHRCPDFAAALVLAEGAIWPPCNVHRNCSMDCRR
jgi:hypothetical protein